MELSLVITVLFLLSIIMVRISFPSNCLFCISFCLFVLRRLRRFGGYQDWPFYGECRSAFARECLAYAAFVGPLRGRFQRRPALGPSYRRGDIASDLIFGGCQAFLFCGHLLRVDLAMCHRDVIVLFF